MKQLKLAAFLLVVLSQCPLSNAAGCESSLPDSIRSTLSMLDGWKIVERGDLSKEDQKLWVAAHAGCSPGIAVGAFTSKDKISYAVALITNRGENRMEQLILFVPDEASYKQVQVVNPTKITNSFVTWKTPPGSSESVENHKRISVSFDSFIYEVMEAYATQHYYAGGHLNSIVTAN